MQTVQTVSGETTPSPALMPRHRPELSKRQRRELAHKQRSCWSKHRYESRAQAADAATAGNVRQSDFYLYFYECEHCLGWHLTRNGDLSSSVQAPAPLNPNPWTFIDRRRSPGTLRRRRFREHRGRITVSRAKRYHDGEARIDLLPTPTIATPAEVEAFFARHRVPPQMPMRSRTVLATSSALAAA